MNKGYDRIELLKNRIIKLEELVNILEKWVHMRIDKKNIKKEKMIKWNGMCLKIEILACITLTFIACFLMYAIIIR